MVAQAQKYTIANIKTDLRNGNGGEVICCLYRRIKSTFKNNINLKIDNILSTENKRKQYCSYEESYVPIYEHFQSLIDQDTDTATKKWLIHGASLVYSWMPTALILHTNKKNEAICSLKKIKENKTRAEKIKNMKKMLLDKDCSSIVNAILPLRNCINNSIRGTSKFLHFSFPEVFPIWDSRVAKALHEGESPKTIETIFTPDMKNTDIKYYVAYAKAVHKVCGDANLMKELDAIPLLKKMESIRKIEHALFLIGHMYKKKKKTS